MMAKCFLAERGGQQLGFLTSNREKLRTGPDVYPGLRRTSTLSSRTQTARLAPSHLKTEGSQIGFSLLDSFAFLWLRLFHFIRAFQRSGRHEACSRQRGSLPGMRIQKSGNWDRG